MFQFTIFQPIAIFYNLLFFFFLPSPKPPTCFPSTTNFSQPLPEPSQPKLPPPIHQKTLKKKNIKQLETDQIENHSKLIITTSPSFHPFSSTPAPPLQYLICGISSYLRMQSRHHHQLRLLYQPWMKWHST